MNNNLTPNTFRIMMDKIEVLTATVADQATAIAAQAATIDKLNETIKSPEERLNKNIKNSSKPPSSDVFNKSIPKSLRKPSGKKPRAQKGHIQ